MVQEWLLHDIFSVYRFFFHLSNDIQVCEDSLPSPTLNDIERNNKTSSNNTRLHLDKEENCNKRKNPIVFIVIYLLKMKHLHTRIVSSQFHLFAFRCLAAFWTFYLCVKYGKCSEARLQALRSGRENTCTGFLQLAICRMILDGWSHTLAPSQY